MLTQKIKGLIKGCSNMKTGRDPEEKNRGKKKKDSRSAEAIRDNISGKKKKKDFVKREKRKPSFLVLICNKFYLPYVGIQEL